MVTVTASLVSHETSQFEGQFCPFSREEKRGEELRNPVMHARGTWQLPWWATLAEVSRGFTSQLGTGTISAQSRAGLRGTLGNTASSRRVVGYVGSILLSWFRFPDCRTSIPSTRVFWHVSGCAFSSLVFLMLSPALCRDSEGGHPVLQGHAREDQQGPHGGTLPWSESHYFCSLAVYGLPGKAGLFPLCISDLRMKQIPTAVTWILPCASCL